MDLVVRVRSLVRLAAATLAATLLTPPPGATAAYPRGASFTINGKGRAHGVGLCMGGAKGRALAGQGYTAILRHYYTGTAVGTSSDTPSRIKVTMGRRGVFSVRGDYGSETFYVRSMSGSLLASGTAGQKVVFWMEGSTYRASIVEGSTVLKRLHSSTPYRVTPGSGTILKVPEVSSRYNHFRGHILATRASNGLNVVNDLPLEDYVKGIAEEPDSWPMQGLYLTAVVARTYAAYRILHTKYPGEPYDLDATGASQYYLGHDYERAAPRLRSAVEKTKGQVVLYRGDIILAAYFSNCGGHTEDAKNQFGADYAYLKGVWCNEKDHSRPYCRQYHGHRWAVRTSFGRFTSKLGIEGLVDHFTGWVRGYHRSSTGSPRLYSVRVVAHPSSSSKTVTGFQIQNAYRLQSNWIWFDYPPGILRLYATPFSPNGDGRADKARISFRLSERASVRIYVKNRSGRVVWRKYASSQPAGWRVFWWNGVMSSGKKAPVGAYRVQVVVEDLNKNVNYTYASLAVRRR